LEANGNSRRFPHPHHRLCRELEWNTLGFQEVHKDLRRSQRLARRDRSLENTGGPSITVSMWPVVRVYSTSAMSTLIHRSYSTSMLGIRYPQLSIPEFRSVFVLEIRLGQRPLFPKYSDVFVIEKIQ
jgi:hypothetical protein